MLRISLNFFVLPLLSGFTVYLYNSHLISTYCITAGLALLIAQGPKKPQTESTSTECSTIKSHPEIHSEVHYSPVKDMEDDMDLDQMSEPEPESNLW